MELRRAAPRCGRLPMVRLVVMSGASVSTTAWSSSTSHSLHTPPPLFYNWLRSRPTHRRRYPTHYHSDHTFNVQVFSDCQLIASQALHRPALLTCVNLLRGLGVAVLILEAWEEVEVRLRGQSQACPGLWAHPGFLGGPLATGLAASLDAMSSLEGEMLSSTSQTTHSTTWLTCSHPASTARPKHTGGLSPSPTPP